MADDKGVRGNIRVGPLRTMLEEQMRKGRSAPEAAGEARWVASVRRDLETLSDQSTEEMFQVIDEWLAEQLDVPIEELGPYRLVATEYARFLGETVDISVPARPILIIEEAWLAWRRKTAPGTIGH